MNTRYLVFGSGKASKNALNIIENIGEIIAFTDNDSSKWGTLVGKYNVISPSDICDYDYDYILICSRFADEIQSQLFNMGISKIRLLVGGSLLYEYGIDNKLKPISFSETICQSLKSKTLRVLFTQIYPCGRTNKLAEILHNNGVEVSLAYMNNFSDAMKSYLKYFKEVIPFYSFNDLVSYVNNSSYDIVHCSNEPDVLSCILINSNKPIIHDTHDFLSIRDIPNINMLALEYIANTKCDGNLYASEDCMKMAIDRYGTNRNNAEFLYNLPSLAALPNISLKKLSKEDGQLHCVYEGGVSSNPSHFRYFEEQWTRVAKAGVHIHFYSQGDVDYCKRIADVHPNIHYEGNADIEELLVLMTKYDIGWHVFNEFPAYKLKLDTTTSNKQYEYLASGLPIVVSNHKRIRDMVETYDVGIVLDWTKDLNSQLKAAAEKKIGLDFVRDNKLTMEDQAEKLISFYERIIYLFNQKHGDMITKCE